MAYRPYSPGDFKPGDVINIPALDNIELVVSAVTDEVFNRIHRRTPVKTGNAQRGWKENFNESANEGRIWNGVPYIGRLERGWSNQAPEGMVAITLEEVPDIIDEAIKRLK